MRRVNLLLEGCVDPVFFLREAEGSLELRERESWNVEEVRKVVERLPDVHEILKLLSLNHHSQHLWGLSQS